MQDLTGTLCKELLVQRRANALYSERLKQFALYLSSTTTQDLKIMVINGSVLAGNACFNMILDFRLTTLFNVHMLSTPLVEMSNSIANILVGA